MLNPFLIPRPIRVFACILGSLLRPAKTPAPATYIQNPILKQTGAKPIRIKPTPKTPIHLAGTVGFPFDERHEGAGNHRHHAESGSRSQPDRDGVFMLSRHQAADIAGDGIARLFDSPPRELESG